MNQGVRRCFGVLCLGVLFLAFMFHTVPAHAGGGECTCENIPCPNNITNSSSAWGAAPAVVLLSVPLTGVTGSVDVEVSVCCRIRSMRREESTPFVLCNLQASCEASISCIRVSKKVLGGYATPGLPPAATLRNELITKIIQEILCLNPCEMGVPTQSIPSQNFEWVISVPSCMDWHKTAADAGYWCISACGPKYCVWAYCMMMDMSSGSPKPKKNPTFTPNPVKTTWMPVGGVDVCTEVDENPYDTCVRFNCPDLQDCKGWIQ